MTRNAKALSEQEKQAALEALDQLYAYYTPAEKTPEPPLGGYDDMPLAA
ncbi:hypothetical protein [Rhodalgimonas zhirmunskyi]|uniref:Uncharacterized protein n=1 Tax=Rhodalgimonas zhirmunskyi TaxID=2964767 RepID=A0AAJ1UEQ9_9RHOB|nr:hypothetical protein [Rhodoalgimonas zhirmunskyi]MDQ2094692.1 hypothetical protein [Rhodoalgimonas zhirmunskyi]